MRTMLRAVVFVAIGFSAAGILAARQTQPSTVPPAQGAPQNEMRRAIRWKQSQYICDTGVKVSVWEMDSQARVFLPTQQYFMKQTTSADGVRYSDGKVVWWSKGTTGFLQEDTPSGNGKMLATNCKLQTPASDGAVTGTVTYLQKMAMPPQAVIDVQLQEVSQPESAPKTVAEQKITVGHQQVPVPFELHFDSKRIDPGHGYELSARILVDGRVAFATNQPYPVLTQGKPSHVDMTLQAAQ
jgi:uncharacterized lipoprotein YbaY